MSKQAGFKKKSMAAAIAALTGLGGTAMAQEQDAALEEVVVLGIRGSLERSMDVKRDANGVVDAISAEDIGKFPDTNLAESMQRITGVSIDRVNGEGSRVTVRGLGPDFNLVTLNGRQLARTTGGRSFDFQNIASDMVTGVEVAKTSDATLPSGGMGATINLLTARPLETPERTIRFSTKGVMDQSSDDADITPEYSGFYSDTFADGKFGVVIAGSIQERESGSAQSTTPGWMSVEGELDNTDWVGFLPQENQVNRPGEGDIYSTGQSVVYKFEEQQRKRENGQLVLQWAPNDDITATVDYNYYQNKIAKQFNDISVYHTWGQWGGSQEGIWTDGPISSPLIYSEIGTGNDVAMGSGSTAEIFEGDMAGVNLEWQASDRLSLEFDAQHSEAERRPDSPWGTSGTFSLAAFVRQGAHVDYTEDLPAVSVITENGISASDIQVSGSVFTNSRDHSEIDQFRFGGNFEINESSDIDFGISRQEVSNTSQLVNVQRNNWSGPGTPEDLPDELFTEHDLSDEFDMGWGDFSELEGEQAPLDIYFTWDHEKMRALAEQLYGDNQSDIDQSTRMGDCGTAFCASTDWGAETDRNTVETSNAAYAQYNFSSQLAGMPFRLNAGLRYEETEVVSTSVVPSYDGAVWAGGAEVVLTSSDGAREYLTQTGEYSYVLPSVAFSIDLTEDLVARAAVSEAITRPGYDDIKGGTTVGVQANNGIGGGSSGNPGLKPFESRNYDLSLEWYYGDTSYASVGLFRKEVSNFISGGLTEKTLFNIPNPSDGALVNEARAAIADGADVTIQEYIAQNHADSPYVEVTYDDAGELDAVRITGNPETDPDIIFRVSQPVNGELDNTIDGMELAVQHFFGESGFGMQANYTVVDSDLEYDPFLLMDQESMIGLSDSANLVGFYEKFGFQARIAYNWRDEFLSSRGQSTGAHPQYTEAYSQIDLNVSYELPMVEGLQVFLEGINVTDEYVRIHGRDELQLMGLYQGGERWQLGARYAF